MNNDNFFPGNNFAVNNFNNDGNWPFNNDKYIDDILKLNIGKKGKFYITVPDAHDGNDKMFEGILEKIGKDHIIVSNPTTGEWFFILLPYLTFISFDEPINYK